MRRAFMASCLVMGALALYGVFGLTGLTTGLNDWAWRFGVLRAVTAAPSDIASSRFSSSAPIDSGPSRAQTDGLGLMELRGVNRPAGGAASARRHLSSLQTFALRVVAIQYGVELGAPSPSAAADFFSSRSAGAQDDGLRWQEHFFLAAILPDEDAFALRSTLPANAVGAEQAGKPSQGTATVPAQFQVTSVPEPPRRRAAARPSSVLNEAQIASIKARLNLTPDQERMWPEVAAALRDISYAKTATAQGRAMVYVDPNSAEVQRLKQVALPLIMRLNGDQMRELKSLAHVMGLDAVAASF